MIGTLERKQNTFLRIKTKNSSLENCMQCFNRTDILIPEARTTLQDYNLEPKYDLVLACHPNAGDNYIFYNKIIKLVEKRDFSIYSPHRDFSGDQIEFMIEEAIPNTKGVLIHFSPITEDIKILLNKTKENNKPFLIFYNRDTINENFIDKIMKSSNSYIGEIKYHSEEEAISLLEKNIDKLLEAARNN